MWHIIKFHMLIFADNKTLSHPSEKGPKVYGSAVCVCVVGGEVTDDVSHDDLQC